VAESSRLVRIPRHLLHIALDDLAPGPRALLVPLLADLPLVPDASVSAQLIGPAEVTLACLAVLARHIGQGLRDANLAIAHDRERLSQQRHKLVFLTGCELERAVAGGATRPAQETVLFVSAASSALEGLLEERHARGLASFVTAEEPIADWRVIDLRCPP
jgi:hypothetical protein